jgi:hypothetical protein
MISIQAEIELFEKKHPQPGVSPRGDATELADELGSQMDSVQMM